jgi:8-amino-7-oxononanoate synthase
MSPITKPSLPSAPPQSHHVPPQSHHTRNHQPALPAVWQAFLQGQSQALTQAGLWRTIDSLDSAPGPTVTLAGQELILLCSNNYLGLATDPRLVSAAQDAAARYGVGSGASRLLSGSTPLHGQLERRLAQIKGSEDCLLFSSGYLANVGTLAALLQPGDTVLSDRLNHASIIDGCRLSGATVTVFPHGDLAAAEQALQRTTTDRPGKVLIVTDSVFSMDGDVAPLPALLTLSQRYGALLMVDEAHATGVLGHGLVPTLGLAGLVPVVMGTCSKALGSLGGFVAGSRLLCDYLRQRARTFFFDTALPPPVVAAALAALDVIDAEPERGQRAQALAHRLYHGLTQLGFAALPPSAAIVPVMCGPAEQALALGAALRRDGILALAVRPPTVPPGTARLRLCTMATHTDAHIDYILDRFARHKDLLRRP